MTITKTAPIDSSTVDQKLQQAITYHKAGALQEAEQLYRSILQSDPLHPDANHNMGTLAVQNNQPEAGLPFFKTALEINPMFDQYWLSYIDTLVQAGQYDLARQMLVEGRQRGLSGDVADVLEMKLVSPLSDEIGSHNTLQLFTFSHHLNGEDLNSVSELISSYINDGKFKTAFQFLNILLEIDKERKVFTLLFYRLLESYFASNNYDYREDSQKRVLLITANINPLGTPFVAISDPNERLKEHLLGICAWILDKSFSHIVIAENSCFNLDVDELQKFGKKFHKHIEYITFKGSELVSEFGKGYGEGEIIKYALENSKVLGHFNYFTKVTGKLYFPFYDFIIGDNIDNKEFFIPAIIFNRLAIDTRIYSISRNLYLTSALDAYTKVNDHEGVYLEHVFFEAVKDVSAYYLPPALIMFGKSGSSGVSFGEYPVCVHKLYSEMLQVVSMKG